MDKLIVGGTVFQKCMDSFNSPEVVKTVFDKQAHCMYNFYNIVHPILKKSADPDQLTSESRCFFYSH